VRRTSHGIELPHSERISHVSCGLHEQQRLLLVTETAHRDWRWESTLRRAKVPYFLIYDLRSTDATRLSAGGVADEWVTQMLRQGDAQVFKKYSQMKLQMKREALEKLNRRANEMSAEKVGVSAEKAGAHSGTVTVQ